MREVSPKELQEYNDKSFKKTQRIFRRRLREIAAGGENKAKYNTSDYCCGERVESWLKSLGFQIKSIGPVWREIAWPKESSSSCLSFYPGKEGTRVRTGTWYWEEKIGKYRCGKCKCISDHSTNYCPHCGEYMHILVERRM